LNYSTTALNYSTDFAPHQACFPRLWVASVSKGAPYPAGQFCQEIGASFAHRRQTARGAISKHEEKFNGSQETSEAPKEGEEARSSQAAESKETAPWSII
jgi:hypothetical protein